MCPVRPAAVIAGQAAGTGAADYLAGNMNPTSLIMLIPVAVLLASILTGWGRSYEGSGGKPEKRP